MHVQLQENGSSSGPAEGSKPRRWLPLVHAPANSVEPAVVVRLPPKLAHLPKRWALGDRVEVRQPDRCISSCIPQSAGLLFIPCLTPVQHLLQRS